MVNGTYEIVAGEDGVWMLYVTLENGEETVMLYVADEDAWMLMDEESGYGMYLFNIEALEQAA